MEKTMWKNWAAEENLHHAMILSAQLIARIADQKIRRAQAEILRSQVEDAYVDVEDALHDLETFAGRQIFDWGNVCNAT